MSEQRQMPNHHAYILRFWETRSLPPDPVSQWRFSLQDVRSEKRYKFPDLDTFVRFLQTRIEAASGDTGPEGDMSLDEEASFDLSGPEQDIDLGGVVILLVEEHEPIRLALQRWLKDTLADCPIIGADANGVAIELARSRSPDVILIDVALPKTNGPEALQQLRAVAPGSVIVAITMDASDSRRQELMSAGATACLEIGNVRRDLLPLLDDLLAEEDLVPEVAEEKTVVCIEDEVDMLSLIRLTLARHKINLITSLGGLEGLETVQRVKPDLVLLDLMMPGVDGWEVYQRMREDDETRDIPVVILTVLDPQWVESQGMDLTGVADYVTKPFAPQDLAYRVGRALELVA